MYIISFIFIFLSTTLIGKQTYVYEKETNGMKTQTKWVLEDKDITGESKYTQTKLKNEHNLQTLFFSHSSKSNTHSISIRCQNNSIQIEKATPTKVFYKSYRLGKYPWIQEFLFSLKPFILSIENKVFFEIINPKNLDMHEMICKKIGHEKVKINEEEKDSLRAKVTLTGFKKMFWHADLWYDPNTGDLLMYKADEGPKTALTTIRLISKS